jgi:ABC-2 family transporter protein
MLELIRRDILLHKKFIVFLGVFYLIYLGYFGSRLDNPRILAIIGPFLMAIFPISIFSREDKFKSLAFCLSLPMTRAEFLRARYALSWIMMGVVYAAAALLMSVLPGAKTQAAEALDVRTLLLTLLVTSLLFGFLMPLSVRFGWMGLIIFLVALQVLGALVLFIRPLAKLILPMFSAYPRAIETVHAAAGPAGALAAGVIVLFLLNYASYRVSTALFRAMEF